jgi:hypothetical protein
MIGDVRKLLDQRPFVPFSVVTSAGQKYRIPTPDHAGFNPRGTRVVVWFDDDSSVTLSALHLTALEVDAHASVA